MKLLLSFHIGDMNIDFQLIRPRGDTLLSAIIYGESKNYRVTGLDPYTVDGGDLLSGLWRSPRLFKAIDDDGVLCMVYALPGTRCILFYRINENYDTLRQHFNTSLNRYPQGSFLFNLVKDRKLSPGIIELYNLDPTSKFLPSVYEVPILDLICAVKPTELTKMFPILNSTIPKLQQRGLFFTETRVLWLERPLNLVYDISHKFFGGEPSARGSRDITELAQTVVTKPKSLAILNMDLPHYDQTKNWKSPPLPAGAIKTLLAAVETYDTMLLNRIILQVKTTRKTSGRYQIPGAGTFGRVVVDNYIVDSLKNRMNGENTLIMNGDGFTLLYTLNDVNAIFFRRKDKVAPEPLISKDVPEEQSKKATVTFIHKSVDMSTGIKNVVVSEEPILNPINVDYVSKSKTTDSKPIEAWIEPIPFKPEEKLPMKETPELAKAAIKYVDEFDYIFQTPIIAKSTMVEFEHALLAHKRLVLLQLPAPYGNLIPWTNVSGENIIERLGIQDLELISFGAASFYRKGDLVFMADTTICLNHSFIEQPTKPALERFEEALAEIVKDKPLVEVINMVTSHYE